MIVYVMTMKAATSVGGETIGGEACLNEPELVAMISFMNMDPSKLGTGALAKLGRP